MSGECHKSLCEYLWWEWLSRLGKCVRVNGKFLHNFEHFCPYTSQRFLQNFWIKFNFSIFFSISSRMCDYHRNFSCVTQLTQLNLFKQMDKRLYRIQDIGKNQKLNVHESTVEFLVDWCGNAVESIQSEKQALRQQR